MFEIVDHSKFSILCNVLRRCSNFVREIREKKWEGTLKTSTCSPNYVIVKATNYVNFLVNKVFSKHMYSISMTMRAIGQLFTWILF